MTCMGLGGQCSEKQALCRFDPLNEAKDIAEAHGWDNLPKQRDGVRPSPSQNAACDARSGDSQRLTLAESDLWGFQS